MTALTWLHLSDWHQKGPDFDRQVVRDALLEDIRGRADRISNDLAAVDFVVFSGDLAFSGWPAEYETAGRELLDPVLAAVELERTRLFIVPGNHDLDRGIVFDKECAPAGLMKHLGDRETVNSWLTEERKLNRVREPFDAYRRFASEYTGHDSPDYACFHVIEVDDKRIGLLGLNSAWMCARNKDTKDEFNDYGYALVGEPQIRCRLTDFKETDLRIAVMHHPFEWLADFDRFRVKVLLRKKCHFILTGHEHCPQVEMLHGTLGECITIPAGASYKRRVADNPRYINAYNFVHFNLENYSGVVYLRRWNNDKDEWEADRNSYADGEYPFSFGKQGEAE